MAMAMFRPLLPSRTGAGKPKTHLGMGPNFGPWNYTQLSEPQLTEKLANLSDAQSPVQGTYAVSLQPNLNPNNKSQDRWSVQVWDTDHGKWTFAAVFDGHAGAEVSEYTVETLPGILQSGLLRLLAASQNPSVEAVAALLKGAISSFDDSIARGVQELLPLASLTDPSDPSYLDNASIRSLINDIPENGVKVTRAMRGTTALITLVDPKKENLWVASLGDCQAVLGSCEGYNKWIAQVLSSNHNGRDTGEADRIRAEHPGEPECMLKDRVLGSIAVTRAIGDHLFKLPRVYTERVFLQRTPGFRMTAKVEDVMPRIQTPPYLSNIADVRHVDLSSKRNQETSNVADTPRLAQPFLILCSDGLMDLYDHSASILALGQTWVEAVAADEKREGYSNHALRLLRHALGGQDEHKVSAMLTVEMAERWMDDTTVIVLEL